VVHLANHSSVLAVDPDAMHQLHTTQTTTPRRRLTRPCRCRAAAFRPGMDCRCLSASVANARAAAARGCDSVPDVH
jgi:hypothetical protein